MIDGTNKLRATKHEAEQSERSLSHLLFFGILVPRVSAQTVTNFPAGITFDGTGDNAGSTSIATWGGTNQRSVGLAAETGMVMLYSPTDGTAPYFADSGVMLQGNPVTVLLSSSNPSTPYNGNFNVTQGYTWAGAPPLLNINGQTGNTTFTNSNVIITGGTLTVGGSPVLTSASAATAGYVNSSNFNSTLSAATPPTSGAWTAAFVPRGNVTPASGTIGGFLSMGTSLASGPNAVASGTISTASGTHSLAYGYAATASGAYSVAFGNLSAASGIQSFARGGSAVAGGFGSTAMGQGVSALARTETALGSWNVESSVASGTTVDGLYGLLRIGNGTSSSARSDALTLLMNGQTTLTNKEWKAAVAANPSTVLADPASTTDSSGNALVVDGHAVLNGKVTLSVAQGDISMGDYQ